MYKNPYISFEEKLNMKVQKGQNRQISQSALWNKLNKGVGESGVYNNRGNKEATN